MKRLLKILALVVVLLVVVASVAMLRRGRTRVELLEPRIGAITEAIYGLGTVKPDRDFELRTAVATRVEQILVHEGEAVTKGAPLVRLDGPGLVRAPFDGVITLLPFHVEDNVFAQQVVLRLEDLRNRYVEVSLEQRGALRIHEGQPARLVFESLRNERFDGTVRTVYPRGGDFIARIEVGKLPAGVLPGMTADVAIEVAHIEKATLIPASAVSGGTVLRERDGKRQKIEVKLGAVDGNWAELQGGDIRPSDLLVLRKVEKP